MSSERADILLKISSDLTDMRKAQEEFRNLKEAGSQSAVKMGASFAVANQAINAAIQGIKGFFKETVAEGVKLNSQLETTARGMAAVMRQYDPGKFGDFNSAVQTSTAMLDDLRAKASGAGLGVSDVVDAFQDAVPVFSSMRVPVKQQTSLLVESARAMQTLGVSTGDTRRELMALFTGHALERSRLAMGLGITKQDLENAREQGRLVELITQRLDEFNRGTSGMSDTLETVEMKLKNAISNQAIDATKELTDAYKDLLVAITDLTNSEDAKTILGAMASIGAWGVRKTADVIRESNARRAPETFKSIYTKNSDNLTGQFLSAKNEGDINAVRLAIQTQYKAIEEEQNRMQSLWNTRVGKDVSSEAKRYARDQWDKHYVGLSIPSEYTSIFDEAKKQLDKLSADIDVRASEITLENSKQAAKEAADAATAEAKRLAEERQQAAKEWLGKNRESYAEQIAAAERATLSDEKQLQIINELIATRESEMRSAQTAAESSAEWDKVSLEYGKKLIELRKQAATLQDRIDKAAEKRAADAKKYEADMNKERLEFLKTQLEAQERALANTLDDLSLKRADVEANRLITNNQKRAESIAILEQERAAMVQLLAVLEAMKGSVGDENGQQLVQARIDALNRQIRAKSSNIGSAKGAVPLQGVERFNQEMRQMAEDSDATFQVMQAGFQGLNSGINDALTNAKNLGDGFKKVLSSIGKGIADAVMQIISMKIAMAAVNGISGMFGFSGGGNVPDVPGHDVGGFTIPGPVKKPAGVVHAGEWVAPQWMVKSPSVGPVISALENARVARRGFASGGATTSDALLPIASRAAGGGGGDTYQFNYTFQSGVTRAEVAALIPVIEQRTIAAVADKQRRRQM